MDKTNMKKISLSEVRNLPDGTRVYVEMIGSDWSLKEKELWNVKQEDGLHYEIEDDNNSISFPYDFDYDGNNMSIACFVGNYGCECCNGDGALYWEDNENNSFIDSNGEILVVVKDNTMRYKVKYCPNCGRKFHMMKQEKLQRMLDIR